MRTHFEGLGRAWLTLFKEPQREIPNLVVLTLDKGGTREAWRQNDEGLETLVMGWPAEAGLRIGVTVRGGLGERLKPISSYPLLEGLPNDMTVEAVHVWENESEGTVGAARNEGAEALWFYNPFLFRDQPGLTPGVRQTFLLAGLAYGVRHALLDEMTISSGPQYEAYAKQWLDAHPGASRLDVPQLTLPLAGSRILVPGDVYGEYQARVPITSVEEGTIGPETIYMLIVEFGLATDNPLRFPLYTPARVCKDGYVPRAGDEIDAFIWIQGRIAD